MDYPNMMIVKAKIDVVKNSMFYGYARFEKEHLYVAYEANNIPNSEGMIYVLPYYESMAMWCVPRNFCVSVDDFEIINDCADHDDVIEAGIEDLSANYNDELEEV